MRIDPPNKTAKQIEFEERRKEIENRKEKLKQEQQQLELDEEQLNMEILQEIVRTREEQKNNSFIWRCSYESNN